jgi:uncharacterized protein YegP (UPF0339 family)
MIKKLIESKKGYFCFLFKDGFLKEILNNTVYLSKENCQNAIEKIYGGKERPNSFTFYCSDIYEANIEE